MGNSCSMGSRCCRNENTFNPSGTAGNCHDNTFNPFIGADSNCPGSSQRATITMDFELPAEDVHLTQTKLEQGTYFITEAAKLLEVAKERFRCHSATMQVRTEYLQQLFNHADEDNSGSLENHEFSAKLIEGSLGIKFPEDVVQKIMKAVDANGDGQLNFGEFVAAWLSMQEECHQEWEFVTAGPNRICLTFAIIPPVHTQMPSTEHEAAESRRQEELLNQLAAMVNEKRKLGHSSAKIEGESGEAQHEWGEVETVSATTEVETASAAVAIEVEAALAAAGLTVQEPEAAEQSEDTLAAEAVAESTPAEGEEVAETAESDRQIEATMAAAVEYLNSHNELMQVRGPWREAGHKKWAQTLVTETKQQQSSKVLSNWVKQKLVGQSFANVSTFVVLYLRLSDLKPLVDFQHEKVKCVQEQWRQATDPHSWKEVSNLYTGILDSTSQIKAKVLSMLLEHWGKVTFHSALNQMTVDNMVTVTSELIFGNLDGHGGIKQSESKTVTRQLIKIHKIRYSLQRLLEDKAFYIRNLSAIEERIRFQTFRENAAPAMKYRKLWSVQFPMQLVSTSVLGCCGSKDKNAYLSECVEWGFTTRKDGIYFGAKDALAISGDKILCSAISSVSEKTQCAISVKFTNSKGRVVSWKLEAGSWKRGKDGAEDEWKFNKGVHKKCLGLLQKSRIAHNALLTYGNKYG